MGIDWSYLGRICYRCGRPKSGCVCIEHKRTAAPPSELHKNILERLIQAYNLGYSDRSSKSVPFQDMDPAEYFEQFLKEPPSE